MLKFFGANDTINVTSLDFVNDVKNKRKLLFKQKMHLFFIWKK